MLFPLQTLCLFLIGVSLILDAGYDIFTFDTTQNNTLQFQESNDISPPVKLTSIQWKLKKNPQGTLNRAIFVVLLITFLLKLSEVIVTFLVLILSPSKHQLFRSFTISNFSPLEGIIVILIEKGYRNMLIIIVRTLPRFLLLVTFVGLGTLLYAILGMFSY